MVVGTEYSACRSDHISHMAVESYRDCAANYHLRKAVVRSYQSHTNPHVQDLSSFGV